MRFFETANEAWWLQAAPQGIARPGFLPTVHRVTLAAELRHEA